MSQSKAIFFGVVLMALHLLCCLAVVQRSPAPKSTFHHFDQQLLRYPFVFQQVRKGVGSPIEDLLPMDVQDVEEWSWEQDIETYKNSLPLYLIIPSVVPTMCGISLWTMRMSGVVTLLLSSFFLFDLTRKMTNRTSGMVAVFFFTMSPAVWQSILIPAPFLSVMLGVLFCLWTLWNSQFGLHLIWMTLSGIAFGVLPRFGETAGDAIPPILLVVPMIAMYLGTTMWRGGWKGVASTFWFLLPSWYLFPFAWLRRQMERYIWDEAHVASGNKSLFSEMYGEVFNLVQSLLMPSIFVLTLYAIWGVRRQRWQIIWLLSGVFVLFVSAVWSDKSYDYYLSSMVPILMIIVGLNFAWDRKKYVYGLCAVISFGTWLTLRHWDIPAVQRNAPAIFLQDTGVGNWQASPSRMFRHWRQVAVTSQPKRDEIARWLLRDEGRTLLDDLEADTLVLVFDSPNSDVIQYIGSIIRPDILFHRSAIGYSQSMTKRLRQHYDKVYAMMSNSVQYPCSLESGLTLKKSIRKAQDVCIWEIAGRSH